MFPARWATRPDASRRRPAVEGSSFAPSARPRRPPPMLAFAARAQCSRSRSVRTLTLTLTRTRTRSGLRGFRIAAAPRRAAAAAALLAGTTYLGRRCLRRPVGVAAELGTPLLHHARLCCTMQDLPERAHGLCRARPPSLPICDRSDIGRAWRYRFRSMADCSANSPTSSLRASPAF